MILRSFQGFGRVDAEAETGLDSFFLETPAYDRVENQDRLVVMGRKGSGKTAIYTTLLARADEIWANVHATGLLFKDYPWELHDAATDSARPAPERYASSWLFLMLLELSKQLLAQQTTFRQRHAGRHRALRRFIRTNWGTTDPGVRETFAKRRYTLTFAPNILGVALGSLSAERVPRHELARVLPRINSWLLDTLGSLMDAGDSYFVLLDDLDRGYDASDPSAQPRLVGLLLAARDLKLWARRHGVKVCPVVFLRAELFDDLEFSEKTKIAAAELESLEWSDGETGANSLKTLIDERVRVATGQPDIDPWCDVFANESIDGHSLYTYMTRLTHLRPRDMIHLANLSLDQAKADGSSHIRARHVTAALNDYSRYLLAEVDAIAQQSLQQWGNTTNVVRRLGRVTFTTAEFAAVSPEPDEERIRSQLRDLYVMGVLGLATGASAVYYYERGARIDDAASDFRVHPGLAPALGILETR